MRSHPFPGEFASFARTLPQSADAFALAPDYLGVPAGNGSSAAMTGRDCRARRAL